MGGCEGGSRGFAAVQDDSGDAGKRSGDVGQGFGEAGERSGDVGKGFGEGGKSFGDVGMGSGDAGKGFGDVGTGFGEVGKSSGDVGEHAWASGKNFGEIRERPSSSRHRQPTLVARAKTARFPTQAGARAQVASAAPGPRQHLVSYVHPQQSSSRQKHAARLQARRDCRSIPL